MYNILKKCNLLQIEQYKYVREISGGKASAAFLYESQDNEKVVIKMLIAPRNEEENSAFQNEATILKELEKIPLTCFSPRVVVEYKESKDYPISYFGIEFCEGVSLRELISKQPLPWKWDQAIEMINRIASALSSCSIRYIHRDLHPGNILVNDETELDHKDLLYIDPGVIVLDYGCSKDQLSYLYYGTLNENKFRHFGAISSWSPEFLFNPEKVDQSHDSWAIGVMLYYFLTGRYPFDAKSFGELFNKYNSDNENFEEIEKTCPKAVTMLVKNLLSIDSKKRFLCGEIISTCSAILYTNLNEINENSINDFFTGRGGLFLCVYCKGTIGRSNAKCYTCGHMLDSDDYIPVLTSKFDKKTG